MSGAAYPCLTCGLSPRNSVHRNTRQFGYHTWVETPEKEPLIDLEIERIAQDMMVNARKQLDKILLDGGMTKEEIQKHVEEAMSAVRINGVPLHAIDCPTCQGKGWLMPSENAPENTFGAY